MLTGLNLTNFRSWPATGEVRLAPITLLFGANSSGKSAIIQALLLLQQTARSTDQRQPLDLANPGPAGPFGSFLDLIYDHDPSLPLGLGLSWQTPVSITADSVNGVDQHWDDSWTRQLNWRTTITGAGGLAVENFEYEWTRTGRDTAILGMRRVDGSGHYEIVMLGARAERRLAPGSASYLPQPWKCYAFPGEVWASYEGLERYAGLPLSFEQILRRVHYLGPLRLLASELPGASGEPPPDVGNKGQYLLGVLAASRIDPDTRRFSPEPSELEAQVAGWLSRLKLIQSAEIRSPTNDFRSLEYWVQVTRQSPSVRLHEVGTGVQQVMPVLAQCYYAQPDSILLFEHPELHLHPAVQAGLADVLVAAVKDRGLQVIVESHSEHLLRRLQRLIADRTIDSAQVALYFCSLDPETGSSRLTPLVLNEYGFITNWPADFFGDEMEDLVRMTEAAAERQAKIAGS